MTISDLIAMHGLGFTCERMSPELYRCRITCEDRKMDFVHLSPAEPILVQALTRLAKAAHQHVNSKIPTDLRGATRDLASFHHWCVIYEYDPESKADHERYLVIRRRSGQLKYVIGIPAYRRLLEITEGSIAVPGHTVGGKEVGTP